MAVRLHLANDHTMFRQGLEAIFAAHGDGIEVVGWIHLAEKDERVQEKKGRGQEEEKQVARPPLTRGKYDKNMRVANRGLAARHTRVPPPARRSTQAIRASVARGRGRWVRSWRLPRRG